MGNLIGYAHYPDGVDKPSLRGMEERTNTQFKNLDIDAIKCSYELCKLYKSRSLKF